MARHTEAHCRKCEKALDWYEVEVSRATDQAFAYLMRSSVERGYVPTLYLWHKTGGLQWAEEKPGAEWELTCPLAERGARSRDQLRRWTWEMARRVPCLPESKS